MAYLGRQPNTGVRSRYIYTATASQTTFSGSDDDGKTLKYEDAAYLDVFLNGVLLKPVTDYTATTKTSVVLTSGAAVSDIVEIVAYDIANIADTVSKANGGTFDGDVTFNGAFTSQGIDDNADATAITIDSSENVFVGRTSDSFSTVGSSYRANGSISATATANEVLDLNRLSTDGGIMRFFKDSTLVGSIASVSGGMQIYATGVNNTGWTFGNGSAVLPMKNSALSDNFVDLGSASYRMDDIYATNGTIQTSDLTLKQDVAELDEAEKRVATAAKGLIRKFRWIDSVEEKGDDARIHIGVIAQDLKAAFEAEGLDPGRYAMFISSTWWEADETYTDDEGVKQTRTNTYETAEEAPEGAVERTRLGVRYNQLLAFIIGAM